MEVYANKKLEMFKYIANEINLSKSEEEKVYNVVNI